MSDKKSKQSPADDAQIPVVTEAVAGKSPDEAQADDAEKRAPKSNFAKAGQATNRAKPRRSLKLWLWLIPLALIAGASAWSWYHWPQLRAQLAEYRHLLPALGGERRPADSSATVATDRPPQTQPTQTQTRPQTQAQTQPQAPSQARPQRQPPQPPAPDAGEVLQRQLHQQSQQLQQQQQTIDQLQNQLAQLQRSVTTQGNRLSQLGNVSREDWQLAEADYLLRLANQRLLLERDARTALGLVEQADGIVRQVNLPDLYGVRQQLARDLAALKLVEEVDREGIYLRLRALEEQMLRLSIQPQFDLATRDAAEESPAPVPGDSAWRNSWNRVTSFMQNSIRIRDGDIDPVLLSPQSEARFRQSLRLNMEQAELALLRGDSTVYKDSLNRARQLLLDYGIDNRQRQVILRELQVLTSQPVDVELPNLSASQTALHSYLQRMRQLSPPPPQPAPAASPQAEEENP